MIDIEKYPILKDNLSTLKETSKDYNDALFVNKNNDIVFVEFKNGQMDKRIYSVRKKIYDSIIIFTDILNMGIGNLRDNMEYILVYNEKENEGQKDVQEKKTLVQSSESYESIPLDVKV